MKTHYLLLLFFAFFSYKINAQNWQAISPQHIYNYQVNANINAFYNTKINTMVNIFVDSIIATNGNLTQYALNTVFDRQVPENGQYQIIHQPQFLQKEMWVQNDTFFFQNPAATKMILSQAQIGQTWIFDAAQNITANVVDIQAATTFGQADSIKIMVLSTNDSLILSKEFGIIRFPFAYNSPYFYQLVGMNDLHLGTTVPMFEDIFNFEVGDMFEYEDTWYIGFPPSIPTNRKYEIISKSFQNNTYIYNIVGNKRTVSYNGTSFQYYYDNISESLIYQDTLYATDISHYNYEPYPFITYSDFPTPLLAITNIEDTTFMGYPTIFRGEKRYSINCDSFMITYPMPDTLCNAANTGYFFEHGEHFTTGKNLGYVSRFWGHNPEWHSIELVAFRKNGITYGTFTPDSLLIAGIENSKNVSFYHLFPNPTAANITLLFDKIDSYKGEIYNVLGKNMTTFFVENKKEQIIDLQDFPVGIYYLEVVNSKGKRSVQKVMKQ